MPDVRSRIGGDRTMLPRHRAVQFVLNSQLFDDISTFSQLEARIARLPTTTDRGDFFEVFAEAYLATQTSIQAKEIWPSEAIPLDVRESLSLPLKDMGVDGVFQTHLGDFNAYQVKFRSARSPLTWDELSTFMGLADRAKQRVLLTNSDTLPTLMNDRRAFFCIRGSDLDRLESRDFQAISEWLKNGVSTKTPKMPRPHQNEALAAIQSALNCADRVAAVMACGSGKTLVALWIAERLRPKTVLVLLPSLALVRQTLHEWLKESNWESADLAYLCVCSDPTVTKDVDGLVVRQSDLDFPISTNVRDVRKFLVQSFIGVKIIFSTYHSAPLVAESMAEHSAIDLAIFDEAHKTAGREGTRFSFALKDSNLSIKKRLFLTATPRHYDIRDKDKQGDARLLYSMDVPEVYGNVVHALTFAEAARREIICGYKVIISVVTSEMVNEDLLRRGEVTVAGDAVKAGHVANQIALQAAVEKYAVKKIITFHRSVVSAQSFVAKGSEGIRVHLLNFASDHVNGAMPTAEREQRMRAFAAAERAIISNARCLTEGVDLPVVDMVAFMSPRRSRIDIVQATGRAMRKANDKTIGYVLVPLFLDLAIGETLEDALQRTGFDEVWYVLQALQEQDDVLADVIRQMREDKGRLGSYSDRLYRERVEILGPSISLEALRAAITAECIDRLGASWDERYGELIAYKGRFGDCRVLDKWPENPQLGTWVLVQRRTKKTGELSEERILRLNAIGFLWDPFDADWEKQFTALLEYKERYGDCNVPTRWRENRPLATWTDGQRQARRKGKLDAARIARLDAIEFRWDLREQFWDKMFAELLAYKQTYGDCAVPDKWAANRPLSTWVGNQRGRKGQLTDEQIRRLDDIDFLWAPKDTLWDAMFEKITAYKNAHGHCNVPQEWATGKQLGTWVFNQRRAKRKGWTDERRIAKLEEIGFLWELPGDDAYWEQMLAALAEYKKAHGDCNPPQKWASNPQLGIWVGNQRSGRRKGNLSDDQIGRLDELGFNWTPRDDAWDDKYTLLVAYQSTHGHCNVPVKVPVLGRWVNKQRQAAKRSALSDNRIERLNVLGFLWNALESSWEEMSDALADFKRVHGHCNVSQGWRENPKLASWVNTQRTAKKRGTLSPDRISRLEVLGFEWHPRNERSERNEML